jgi:ABC-2 type transport system permease protein
VSWKNVLRLYGVYTKSYRLIVKDKWRNYRESRWKSYAEYGLMLLFGAGLGLLIAYATLTADFSPDRMQSVRDAAADLFVAFPIVAILFSLYVTQTNQIQRMSANTAIQPIYWFPLTWEEHTLASILSSMQTAMVLSLLFIPAFLIPAFAIGLLPLGVLTVVTLAASAIITGATSEILKGVQIRIVESISKRAGRLTVWLRFAATLAIVTLVYVFYFTIFRADTIGMIQSMASGIMLAWFVPYLWPGIVLYEAYRGAWPEAVLFTAGIVVFTWVLFRLAVRSNEKFALRDTQVVRISDGAYAPKRGLLERLGISTAVAAIMRKDLRAYTRRQELMYIFIMPIVFVVSTLMPVLAGGKDQGLNVFAFFSLALEPPVVLAVFLAVSVVGSEGERRWFLIMSPLSPRSFVRAKYLFCALVCGALALGSVAAAGLLFPSTPYWIATGAIEALLLSLSVGMVALSFGIRGADFREAIKQQTIRPRWMLAGMAVSMILALVVALPVLAYGAADALGDIAPGLVPSPLSHTYLFVAWAASAVLALAIGLVSYLFAVRSATRLFRSMEA